MNQCMLLTSIKAAACILLCVTVADFGFADPPPRVPTYEEVLTSKVDLWGEAALSSPKGPTFSFFESLLPPLRYVDASFRHYPLVLSAPGATVKGRLISNGSQINALARQPNWRGEIGTPISIRVGDDLAPFGEHLSSLEGPTLHGGYLPIVRLRYRHAGSTYGQEVFAAVDPALSSSGLLLAKFTVEEGEPGKLELQIESAVPLKSKDGTLRNTDGKVIACSDPQWRFNPARNTLTVALERGESASVAIFTKPADSPLAANTMMYEEQRRECEAAWEDLLKSGMQLQVPEQVVQNAWRASIIGSFSLLAGDEIRYSAGNQYAKLYVGEGTDAMRSLLLMGYERQAREMIVPLFDYTRNGLEFHQAAFKLQMLAHYFWLTRDVEFVEEQRPRWEKELNLILEGRESATGLLPREKYCGDISTRVYSLNSNANCWRALRDMSAVLREMGKLEEAESLKQSAADYRRAILQAIDGSKDATTEPPFVPIALSGEEDTHDPIWATRMGGYWNIMMQYVLGSGVFRYDSETATDVLTYMQRNGGLCMGMLRTGPGEGWWVGGGKINDLYGMRYALLLLQRDEVDRALVSFYGKLAQGMTRDTFIGAEGTSIRPLDKFGRQMYLPPNSAANASFLWQLRNLVVQDWDLDDDGSAETLRLLFATPRAWLADGSEITVKAAPTSFGDVSTTVKSQLSKGQVLADIVLPKSSPKQTLLRLRLPAGWDTVSAVANEENVPVVAGNLLDLTGFTGTVKLRVTVRQRRLRK